jgi:hypothetical protein
LAFIQNPTIKLKAINHAKRQWQNLQHKMATIATAYKNSCNIHYYSSQHKRDVEDYSTTAINTMKIIYQNYISKEKTYCE